MRFALQKTTLLDFPEHLACTLFIPGCNLRCPYCHNKELALNQTDSLPELIPRQKVSAFLKKRKNVLQGVAISGGEPLLYKGLKDLMEEIHSLGLKVKLDTNGLLPHKLEQVDPDYTALDLKTLPENYSRLLGDLPDPGNLAEQWYASLEILKKKKNPFEIRTTMLPAFINRDSFDQLCSLVKGASLWRLNAFRPAHTLDPSFQQAETFSRKELQEFQEIALSQGISCFFS